MKTTIHKELTKMFNASLVSQRKYKYFMWKNGISGQRIDYPSMTEKELMKNMKLQSLHHYEKWESTEEYLYLKLLLTKENMQSDLFNIYDAVKNKALEGDDKAIKTFLELEREVVKRLDDLQSPPQELEIEVDEVVEDDGLKLSMSDIEGLN